MIESRDTIFADLSLAKQDSTAYYLRIAPFTSQHLNKVTNSRYYTVIWIQEGHGTVKYEFREQSFSGSCLLFFSPHQPYKFTGGSGIMLQFASDFYCIERNHLETVCSGVLFNNIYEAPLIHMDEETDAELRPIIEKMQDELVSYGDEADPVLLLALLKVFLIQATRSKKSQSVANDNNNSLVSQQTVQNLKALIETRYRDLKRPADYAKLLSLSVGALNKLSQKYLGRSLTELIQDRVMLEAKRELVLTDKLVKTIAHELGYDDEYYFSRLFSKLTGLSPTEFRQTYLWMD